MTGNEERSKAFWDRCESGEGPTVDELLGDLGGDRARQAADEPDELALAAGAVLMQLDYLQSLWGKEGVTNALAERLRKALEGRKTK